MGALEIRAGAPSDAGRLTEIAHAAKRHWGYPESWMAAWRRDLTVSPDDFRNITVLVAEYAGDAVGFVALDIAGNEAEVDHLWVLPEHMGRGVGRRLLRDALQHCRHEGVGCLWVASDPHATQFYVKMGARHAGQVDSVPAPRTLPRLRFDLTDEPA